eukprot:TRINITY_DN79977_c0_g1_i1.p1 TRINITY_DN79977_c0_g1~~TRINITY_DN79977_c0_g1_i1.p1  ORF type:complete len:410 (-),score=51.09 TRINITY_DN79977_c0_g1_i1:15-1244(-)
MGAMVDPAWRLCFVTAMNCMIITSMYTLAPFMVLEFGVAEDRQALGFWSGFVVAAFFLSRSVTLPFWGRLADSYGRYGVICASLLLTGLSTFLCGFATCLESVAAARLLTGACSAVHSSCCAMGHDVSGNRGLAIVESGFSVGKLLGPGLAGFLLRLPCRSWLSQFPFFAPFFGIACLQLLAFLAMPVPRANGDQQNKLLDVSESLEEDDSRKDNRWQALHAQILSAGLVVVSVAMEECFVLYGVGALHIDAPSVGKVYLAAGVADLLLQNTLLLQLIQSADTAKLKWLRKSALLLLSIVLGSLPFLLVPGSAMWGQVILLGLFCGVRTSSAYVFFVTNMALLNEASPGNMASAQSVRMAIGSALQVVGPPLGASSYAWSATSGMNFPLDVHFTFLVASMTSIGLAVTA